MIAERIKFDPLLQSRHQTLTVLFDHEEKANAFVARLKVFEIDVRFVTIIGVALGEPPKRISLNPQAKPQNTGQYTVRGIISGCLIALAIGLILYATNFLQLSFLEALLIHTLALMILGGVIGGAIGAILASVQAQKIETTLPPQHPEGFLVTLKLPSHLLPQGETIAREAGAKKVIA